MSMSLDVQIPGREIVTPILAVMRRRTGNHRVVSTAMICSRNRSAAGSAPPIDVHFLDYPDKEINELGARGIGEIGLAGIAAAITAAVHHATGVRVRELPVKIEHLLT